MDDFEFFRYAIKKNKKLTVLIGGYNVIISKKIFNLINETDTAAVKREIISSPALYPAEPQAHFL